MHAMLEDVLYNIFGEKYSLTGDYKDLWQPRCLTVGLGFADIPIIGRDNLSKCPVIAVNCLERFLKCERASMQFLQGEC